MTVEEVFTAHLFADDLMCYIAGKYDLPISAFDLEPHMIQGVPTVFTPEIGKAVKTLSEKMPQKNNEMFKRYLERNRPTARTMERHFIHVFDTGMVSIARRYSGSNLFLTICAFVVKMYKVGCECGYNFFSIAVPKLADELNSKLSWGSRDDFRIYHDAAVNFNSSPVLTDTTV